MLSSDFSEDTLATASHLAMLEAAYEQIISNNAATQQLLQAFMQRSIQPTPISLPPPIPALPSKTHRRETVVSK
jgi:hypothetical protein